jgi:glutathione S-transferase
MHLVYIVMGLALAQYMYFTFAVGGARGRFGVKAPATSGHEVFDRYFRVQMNTLELIVVLIPALLLFATYVDARIAAGLGAVYIIGRFMYFRSYITDPPKRGLGYGLSLLPITVLLIGGIIGAALQVIHGT